MSETYTNAIVSATCADCPIRKLKPAQLIKACGKPDTTPYTMSYELSHAVGRAAYLSSETPEEKEAQYMGDLEVPSEYAEVLLDPTAEEECLDDPGYSTVAEFTQDVLQDQEWTGLAASPEVLHAVGACVTQNQTQRCIQER